MGPCRTAWYLMCENGGTGVWATDYRYQYNLKDAEWLFDAVLWITDRINVFVYIYPDIELKLKESEEE